MSEGIAQVKITDTNGFAIIKKSVYMLQLFSMIFLFCVSISLGAYYFFSIEPRVRTLEGQYIMNAETNMNLKEYLESQGYKWIRIPQGDKNK